MRFGVEGLGGLTDGGFLPALVRGEKGCLQGFTKVLTAWIKVVFAVVYKGFCAVVKRFFDCFLQGFSSVGFTGVSFRVLYRVSYQLLQGFNR